MALKPGTCYYRFQCYIGCLSHVRVNLPFFLSYFISGSFNIYSDTYEISCRKRR